MSRYYNRTYRNDSRRTKVQLYWNNLSSAYSLKFADTYKWTQMQGVLTWIKQTIIWTEREYDADLKTWFIHEKHIPKLKELIELMSADFDLDFLPKPEGQTSFEKFIPVEVYLETFAKITGLDTKTVTNATVRSLKKVYYQTCMYLHPDKNPDRPDISARMYDLNE